MAVPQTPTPVPEPADPDKDSRSNLLEYALGTQPKTSDASTALPALARNGANVEFTRQRDCTNADLIYICESSDDLVNWTLQTSTRVSTAGRIETMRATVLAWLAKKFFRLRIERPKALPEISARRIFARPDGDSIGGTSS
ncbi:MAG: hypothetical protein K1X78_00290 [Verrucomicrobiaceae bacterium]|nr:hypothetical protein [Verrucomicrobiaceae bacterium]